MDYERVSPVDNDDPRRRLAVRVASRATTVERDALLRWAYALMDIRRSSLPARRKASHALRVTVQSRVVWPAAKLIWGEVRRHAWDERGLKGRFGLTAAATSAILFGGQGAGIAALGTAVGVPLWVVFGAGGVFVAALIEELRGKRPSARTTYTVIDAEKKEHDANA